MTLKVLRLSLVVCSICPGSFLFAAEQHPAKALEEVLADQETLDEVFPKELSFEHMGVLAKGEALVLSGVDLKAVDPSELYAKLPSFARQYGRKGLALIGAAESAGAKLFGAIKRSGNIVVKSYKYTPAGVRAPFQFSVYYIAQGLPDGDKQIFDDVKRRDVTENLKFSHGFSHPEVKKDLLADKQSFIQQTQLAPVMKEYATYNTMYEKAFLASDKITADYLRILIRKIEAEIFAIRMKLNFLEVTAPSMIAADKSLEVDVLIDTMDKTVVSNFYTRELQEEAKLFKETNQAHISSNLPKYRSEK